ncbi:hypothetical protein PI86_08825 [Burkholderia sp. A9]|uniref:hypothetical protein n=1 Tax=Burkholderia sp. A9 TaxID=1365108 RepID=UPI0005732F22|nr:hypothetical protein [Burkholderia sp. A9]KHK59421.1 hypothetical protein PI86_08825 [Burkholderia sp. A9]
MVANRAAPRHALSLRPVARRRAPRAKPPRLRAPRYHRAVSQRALIQGAAFFRNAGRRDPAEFFPDPP